MPLEEASKYTLPFEWVMQHVKPERDTNNRQARREKWWQYGEKRPAMRAAIKNLNGYFAIPITAKYTSFQAIKNDRLPLKMMVVASDDFYILGVLNSTFHRNWVKAQCSTLEDRIRYTNTTCFETFPFLWDEPENKKEPVRKIMTELDEYRMAEMKDRQWGITQLYNAFYNEPASRLYKLHRQLDEAVCAVYGWKFDAGKNYNEKLYELNLQLHAAETQPLLAGMKKPKRSPKKG